MFRTLYVKMTAYFLGIIVMTLAAVTVLFILSVGKPLSREMHSLLRNHTRYLGTLVSYALDRNAGPTELSGSLQVFSESYGFGVALFGPDRTPEFISESLKGKTVGLTDGMVGVMNLNGMFIQRGHFGKPVIYAFPVRTDHHGIRYLYITQSFPVMKAQGTFALGLAMIGLFMMTAVYPLTRGITRPVTGLTRALENIAAGNFDDTPASRRNDEIGDLVRVFRKMSRSVNTMISSKKQFMADISHELCSPLARIRVGIELIRDSSPHDQARNYATAIEKDVLFMDRLIGNLARFSLMDLPEFSLRMEPVNPGMLVNGLANRYAALTEQSGVALQCRTAPGISDIEADPDRLTQVLTNLVDNAVRYSVTGDTITMGTEDRDDQVCFFVEDQGPGIPETDAHRIFEPLYRNDSSRNPNTGGSGLGLAISKKIVELHGGVIGYNRNNGVTRFFFHMKKTNPRKDIQ